MRSFRTVGREISSVDSFRLQLAKTRVDIAKVIMKKNPKLAKEKLYMAGETFKEFGRTKEVNFVSMLLSRLLN